MKKSTLIWSLIFFVLGCAKNDTQVAETFAEPASKTVTSDTTATTAKTQTILFLGDSLTAGYGVEVEEAFPSLIQEKIDAQDWHYNVVNAGISGDTSSGGLARTDWLLQNPVDILVLELGANDGLRGVDLSLTKSNLQAIIDKTKAKYPSVKIVLAGMQVPPNLGEAYTTTFKNMYPTLAKENQATLIPFLLEDVAGIPTFNQADQIHPTAAGHKMVAETVWKTLEPILASLAKS